MSVIAASTTEYSTQINKIEQRTDPAINVLNSEELGGRVRIAQIAFTAVANIAEDVYVKLAVLPRSAKVIGLHLATDTATATSDILFKLVSKTTPDTTTALALATVDSSAAAVASLALGEAQISGDEAYVMALTSHDTSGTVIALGDTIVGHVLYVI